jgi:hypothetical protein
MKVNHSRLLMGALLVLFAATAAWCAGMDSYTITVEKYTLGATIANSTQTSARQALRDWLDCFINADGGAFYDMLPSVAKTKFDNWFTRLSASASWQSDPESAKVPTSRSFLILAFEEAKKQGGLGMNVNDEDFEKVANTCQLSGNGATFNGLDGTTLTFVIENNAWKMDSAFANNMVDGIINSVGDID